MRRRPIAHLLTTVVVLLATVVGLTSLPGAPRAMADASTGAGGGLFTPLQVRLLDTRTGSPMAANVWQAVTVVGGSMGAPSGVTAVEVSFTVINPAADGYVHAAPGGVANPGAAIAYANYVTGEKMSNSAVVAVANGAIQVQTTTSTDLVVDLQGYYSGGATG